MTPPTPEQVKAEELREALAALCHEQWSGWMEYLFNNCEDIQGMTTLPAWADERWRRQMMTPYAKLSEAEKESDRHEADRILGIMRTWRDYTRATEQRSAAVEKVVELLGDAVAWVDLEGSDKSMLFASEIRAALAVLGREAKP